MKRTPRVLVTGFEPFAGAKLNASEMVVRWHKDQQIEDVSYAILPVEYERSAEELIRLIESVDPQIIFSLGQAEGRAKVSFERVAINLDDARIADNGGELRRDVAISAGGEAAYMATLPVRKIVDQLVHDGHPVEESLSAGAFVCNHLFYSALEHLNKSESQRWMGFVHLPLVVEQGDDFPGKPTLAKEVQGTSILSAINIARFLWSLQSN